MPSAGYIWFDGKLVRVDDAKTHVLDHSLHYGSAVFEGIKVNKISNNRLVIFRLDDHLERFLKSASTLKMSIAYTRKEVKKAIIDTLIANNIKSGCYIRPLVWFGSGELRLTPDRDSTRLMIAILRHNQNLLKKGVRPLRVMISSKTKPPPVSIPPHLKAAGVYLLSLLAQYEAKEKGFEDAILLDHNGHVAEGTSGNIFCVREGKLMTPPLHSILPGITRDTILELVKESKLKVSERTITVNELTQSDELFYSGTSWEIAPIGHVNGKRISDGKIGPITAEIKKRYFEIVRGDNSRYKKWYTYVKLR
ncbi:MAG: branched-chain amino acid transaminase [Nitrososphaerales archaeon]